MPDITTRYGIIPAARRVERWPNGELRSCIPSCETTLITAHGPLTPQFTSNELRRKDIPPVMFHGNGELRTISLQEQSIISTPAGEIRAEMVSFHPSGTVKRILPLNGKLSGYWTQEDETALVEPVTLATPLGRITAKLLGLCFYLDGPMKSMTLWPEETLGVDTPHGLIPARIGVSFWPDGALRSLETAAPYTLATPVGDISVYDPDAVGINGDVNSLEFSPSGELRRLATISAALMATDSKGAVQRFTPAVRDSLCSESEQEVTPMRLEFTDQAVRVHAADGVLDGMPPVELPYNTFTQRTERFAPQFASPFSGLRCSV